MIYESHFWKKELEKHIKILKAKMAQKRWLDVSFAKNELSFFTSAYIIRKIIEAKKLTTYLEKEVFHLTKFIKKSIAPTTNIRNRHEIDQLYNLESPQEVGLSLKDLANRIIHSYVYEIEVNELGNLKGFFFTSDKDKDSHLYYVSAATLLELLITISDDWPTKSQMERDPKTGDFKIINS